MNELRVSSGAGHIEAQIVLPEREPPMTVVLCHGLPSGDARDPDDPGYPGLARELAARGLAGATFSFRGCYGSDGDISFGGWVDDLRAVIDAVAQRARGRIAVAGSSLGGSAAIVEASGDDRVVALATLAAPADHADLVASRDDFLDRVRSIGLIRDPGFPADADAWARELAHPSPEEAAAGLGPRPLLVVHGAHDDVVPVEHARRLVAAASGPVTSVILREAGHQLRRNPAATEVLFRWLQAQAS